MNLAFTVLATAEEYNHYPLARVSRAAIDKMRSENPGDTGRPMYFSVERNGFDLHVEMFPLSEPEKQS